MKNITGYHIVLIWIVAIFRSPRLALCSIPVDEAKIRSYLTTWLNQEETYTGHTVRDKDAFLGKYTDGKTVFYTSASITLKDVAQLHISFMEGSATLTVNDPCDLTDQLWMTYPLWKQEEIYNHFKKLDAAGKKYCNMFLYLTCKEDTTVTPTTHRCQCPSGMLWEGGKCVIKSGEICSGRADPSSGITYVDGNSYAIFNFFTEFFEINIPHPTCEDKNHCGNNKCEPDEYHAYHSTPKEIAAFLRKLADADPQYAGEEALKTELIRYAMEDITYRYKSFERLAISMELRTETLLQDHGQTCDYALDSPLDTIMKTYNSKYSEDFRLPYLGYDMMRIRFQKSVVDAGSVPLICNHFKLLRCTPTGICDCKDTLIWNTATKSCTTKTNYQCSSDNSYRDLKLFSLRSEHSGSLDSLRRFSRTDDDDDVDCDDEYGDLCTIIPDPGTDVDVFGSSDPPPLDFSINYYEYMTSRCETGTACEEIDIVSFPQWICVAPGDNINLMTLREDFSKKFSVPLDGDCSASDHLALFNTKSEDSSTSFPDIRKAIEALVASPVKYCRLTEYETCSTAGKCTCVPPMIPTGTACTAPPYAECGKTKSIDHVKLDSLIMPITIKGTESAASNLFCPPNVACVEDPVFTRRVCTCDVSTQKFGEKCNIEPHYHVDHLDVRYLPESMRTPEGRILISNLHEAMTTLSGTETLNYGQACNGQHEQDLNTVRSFLAKVRDDCNCYLHNYYGPEVSPWTCSTQCQSRPDFEKSKFEVVVQNAKNLAVKAHPLCQRTKNVQCLSGMCQCPEHFFLEKEECRPDLGTEGLCSHGRQNVPVSVVSCREGAICGSQERCISDNPIITQEAGVRWKYNEPARSYVTNVKAAFKKYLMDRRASLHLLRSLKDDHACNHEMEAKFETTLAELNPILDSIKDGDIQHDRGDIRRMEPIASSIREMANQPKAKFCREMLHCSPLTNTCERQKKPYSKNFVSSPRGLNQVLITIVFVSYVHLHLCQL